MVGIREVDIERAARRKTPDTLDDAIKAAEEFEELAPVYRDSFTDAAVLDFYGNFKNTNMTSIHHGNEKRAVNDKVSKYRAKAQGTLRETLLNYFVKSHGHRKLKDLLAGMSDDEQLETLVTFHDLQLGGQGVMSDILNDIRTNDDITFGELYEKLRVQEMQSGALMAQVAVSKAQGYLFNGFQPYEVAERVIRALPTGSSIGDPAKIMQQSPSNLYTALKLVKGEVEIEEDKKAATLKEMGINYKKAA